MKLFMPYRLALVIVFGVMSYGNTFAQENMSLCMSGMRSQQAGLYDQAIADLDNCIKTGNLSQANLARTYRILGMNYNAKKDYGKAVDFYNQALALNPFDPWNDYVNRGNAQSGLGDLQKAISDYEAALKFDPNLGAAYFNRGIVYEKMRNIEQAKADISLAYQKGFRSAQISERMSYYNLPTGGTTAFDATKALGSSEQYNQVLSHVVQQANTKATCFERDESIASIRVVLDKELLKMRVAGLPTPNQIALAFYTQFSCPLSPYRTELKPATEKEIEGAWIYPEGTQKFRFPPQSNDRARSVALPNKCDGVGYFPNGELRTMQIVGSRVECNLRTASDLDFLRKNPRVASWNMLSDGRLNVTRTDVPNHVEEWDMFVVTQPFESRGTQFKHGELLAYMRKTAGNDLGIATMFWHLQKLPQ